MRSTVLIYNPASGAHRAARRLPAIVSSLRAAGYDVAPRPTAGPDDATRLAREAAAQGVEVVFAMGGDGTLREVAAGLLGSRVALGFLPMGTANVMTYALGLPRRATQVAALADRLVERAFDVGICGEHPFLMMVSAGLDAAIMANQSPRYKRRYGRAAFAVAGIRHWWRDDGEQVAVAVGAEELSGRQVSVCNIPFYGGPFRMAPEADVGDGLLDLVVLTGHGRLATLGFIGAVGLRRHLRRSDVEHRRLSSLTLGSGERLRIQVDGDVRWVETPVEVRIGGQLQMLAMPDPA